jgi:hypothetical protein
MFYKFWVHGTCSQTDTSSLTRRFVTVVPLFHAGVRTRRCGRQHSRRTDGEITSAGSSAGPKLIQLFRFTTKNASSQREHFATLRHWISPVRSQGGRQTWVYCGSVLRACPAPQFQIWEHNAHALLRCDGVCYSFVSVSRNCNQTCAVSNGSYNNE